MVNTDKLKGLILERRKTQEDVARALNITPKTFYLKMKKGVFNSNEMEIMIDYLEMDNPLEIFFANKTT